MALGKLACWEISSPELITVEATGSSAETNYQSTKVSAIADHFIGGDHLHKNPHPQKCMQANTRNILPVVIKVTITTIFLHTDLKYFLE
jgi:hypothetical protein